MNRRAFLILAPPGLEALAAEEAAELEPGTQAAPAGSDLPGRLLVQGPAALDWRALRLPRRASRFAGEVAAGDIDELRDALAAVELPELATAASFRVSAHAAEGASLAAQDAARAAGAVLQPRHGTPVSLRDYELEVRLDLGRERALVSVELHREELDKRIRRPRPLRSALKPTVAAALVRLASAHQGPCALLDPTCGSGTIAIEAKAMNPALTACGSDWDEETVALARETVSAAGVAVELKQADARELSAAWPQRFDAVVFNPPYGVKVGRGARIDSLHAGILASAAERLQEGGRIAVLTPRRRALEQAAAGAGLAVERALPVAMGGLRPVAYLLRRA